MSESLLQQIAGGDREAVAECVNRYGNLVWSLARRFTHNRADAEDAVQDVFIELWAHAQRFDPAKASETTFVGMVARRRLIDRMRKTGREPRSEELSTALQMPDPSAADDLEIRDEAARAQRLIRDLKPDQQKIIGLAVYQGMTHQSIAEHMGLPLGTVKTHLRRGLLRLRAGLEATRLNTGQGAVR